MYVSKVILTEVFLGTSYLRVCERSRSEAVQHHWCKTLGCWILAHLLPSMRLLSAMKGIGDCVITFLYSCCRG